ncbi:MAG: SCO2525 family SAM-dependent methyltransferase [Actinomycetota bacterium]|nr:SCO2525 family SAM-dependent methyltransferase [Actinomycetota bacterium]
MSDDLDQQSAARAGVTLKPPVGNADVDWDEFDSQAYFKHNYGELRDDDAAIITVIADFFQGVFPAHKVGSAIDVGSGTNLYPALTMVPYSSRVTLFERAFTNRQWLQHELRAPQSSWKYFWDAIAAGRPAYANINNPLDVLHTRAHVERGNVFSLGPDQYDMGTMFFVAESITTRTDEFERATRQFVNSLHRNAPFAAAFMRDSSGYLVGNRFFPACSINRADVQRALAPVARNVDIVMVESDDLREGYGGMMVATGRKK